MTRSVPLLALAAVAIVGAACATAPAMRSPLRERLEKADTPEVEDAARACLDSLGWISDPVGSVSGGSNVVSAHTKEHESVQVYVHQADQKPRVTGGPDDDKFWKCLAQKLGGAGGADDTGGDGGADKGDKDKDKGDKDPGDKGGGAS
jgi:hypothetical protein